MNHDIVFFIRNIFRLNFDSADLLASFALHIPTRSTRAYKLFSEPRARVQSDLFCRLPRVNGATVLTFLTIRVMLSNALLFHMLTNCDQRCDD